MPLAGILNREGAKGAKWEKRMRDFFFSPPAFVSFAPSRFNPRYAGGITSRGMDGAECAR